MNKKYTVIDFEKAKRKTRVKEWARSKTNNAANWFYNNKEVIMVLGPVFIGAVTTGVKVVGKRVNLKKEKNLKNLYCYDRSLGHYWRLRRKLSNSEWVEIDRRRNKGERLADILNELKVLK